MVKKNRNTNKIRWIAVWITLGVLGIMSIIMNRASVYEIVSLFLFVFLPIIVDRYKNNTDKGTMIVRCLLLGFLWIGIFFILIKVSENHPVLDKILFWPMVEE